MSGTLIFIKKNNIIASMLFQNNVMMQLNVSAVDAEFPLGGIFVGKVQHIVKNLDAAFVEYAKGKVCFLSRQDCMHPILLGRQYDGRLVQGDELLVQIQKEPMKEKEAGGTTNLSFTGKYIVLTVGKQKVGFSHKHSVSQKKRLKEWMEQSEPFHEAQKRYGIVFRTNAGEVDTLDLLEAELTGLKNEADRLLETGIHKSCFSMLKKPKAGYIKNLQDIYSDEYSQIVTDDPTLYHDIREYLMDAQPRDIEKLRFYDEEQEKLSLSKVYPIEKCLNDAIQKKVWLKSGGWIVIEPTEALISIDVNSGRSIKSKDSEEHFLQVNVEAAREIVHQIRLRSLSGMILIDFISMKSKEHIDILMHELKRYAAEDPIKTDVIDMTPLGLVEITRRKIRKPIHEQKENIKMLLDGFENQ